MRKKKFIYTRQNYKDYIISYLLFMYILNYIHLINRMSHIQADFNVKTVHITKYSKENIANDKKNLLCV